MASQVTVWKAADGSVWDTEEQCRAYELRLALLTLGKQAESIKVNQFGQVDIAALQQVASSVLADIKGKVESLQAAMDGVEKVLG